MAAKDLRQETDDLRPKTEDCTLLTDYCPLSSFHLLLGPHRAVRLSKQNTHLAPQGGAKNGLAEVNIPARNPTPEIRGYLYGKPGMEPIAKAHGEKEM